MDISPHVLIFPLPVQGHVNSMLKLAEILCLAGLQVTFLLTDHNHSRLLRHSNIQSRFDSYHPRFSLATVPDGLPADHPRSGDRIMDLIGSLKTTKPMLRDLMVGSDRPFTCVIADGILSFVIDVAEEIGIPIVFFRTVSGCAFWSYFRIHELIQAGEIPFEGNDLDVSIKSVPGMEGFLRQRDLPSFCRTSDLTDENLQMVMTETRQSTRPKALILNTFEDLEGPILSQIRTQCPNLYTIGPLHAHLNSRLAAESPSSMTSSNSLWEEDKSCIKWLDQQPSRSVIYVSFGSITTLKRDQLMEFWHGLVNSGKRFLWVIRMDLVAEEDGQSEIPKELEMGTRERGHTVGWAPQEQVLAHPAVGGFLTHCGWNSTLESIFAGVPMICWPFFADQQTNSRFVSEVWKLGMDMKDTCDRVIVEKMVKDLMAKRREEIMKSADTMANLARKSISKGGSSYSSLDRLVQDIRSMNVKSKIA